MDAPAEPAAECLDAVLLDAVGTLLMPDPPVAAVYAEAGRRHGSRLSAAEILPRFRAAFAAEERLDREIRGWRTDEPRELARWRSIVQQSLPDARDHDALTNELWRHFADGSHWRLQPTLARQASEWLDRGMTVGIASNFDERLAGIASALGEPWSGLPLFLSSRVGWRKPAAEFFAAIEQSLGVAPARLLMVGDDLANDIEPARARGWQTWLWRGDE